MTISDKQVSDFKTPKVNNGHHLKPNQLYL